MKSFKQFFFEATQSESLAPIVIYPGRFVPYHYNHHNTYKYIVDKFGANNVYILTSNKTEEKSPFNFEEKKKIITTLFGVSSDHVIQVTQPYLDTTAISKIDPTGKRPVIAVVGEKDEERLLGFKDYQGNKIESSGKLSGRNENVKDGASMNAYYMIAPAELMTLKFDGKTISGTVVRDVFGGTDNTKKKELFKALYGKYDKEMYSFIVGKIEGTKKLYSEMKRYELLAKKLALKLRDIPKIKANREQVETYKDWVKYWKAMSKNPVQLEISIPRGSAPKVRD